MIEIDGSQGEGGGQIIRSSLALAAVTGQAIRLFRIRAGRNKPGLMRQHLTAVRAAAAVCGGRVEGADIGAQSMTFEPQALRGGEFAFRIGTAGSATLVAQTVLPALMLADSPSTVTFEGGTHNPFAPPFDYFQRVFLPQLTKAGPQVTAQLESYGFYPAGGGQFRLQIQPCKALSGWQILDRGGPPQPRVTAIVSQVPRSVADRECDTIRRKTNWSPQHFEVHEVRPAAGPGNVVMIELVSPNVTEIVSGFGKRGVKAENVARKALRSARSYLACQAPVGEYLADQLMMPMALAAAQGHASAFHSPALSKHSQTQRDVLKIFLDIQIDVEEQPDGTVVVHFRP